MAMVTKLAVLFTLCTLGAAVQPSVRLNNGVNLPLLALGTGGNMGNSSAAEANVRRALSAGFVAIDTARDYIGVQKGVGAALKGVPRESFFITTKVGGLDAVSLPSHEHRGVTTAMEQDLATLGLQYVDMMLLHFPPVAVLGSRCRAMQEQWRALEDFYAANKTRAIGVSNYCQSDLECVLQSAKVTPGVNQLMFHVGMGPDPRGLKSYCQSKGIVVQAYSPLGAYDFKHLPPQKDHTLITGNLTNGIGARYNKTGAQVALRWLVQHGVPVNTESSSAAHLQQDLQALQFELSPQDMGTLDAAAAPAGEPNNNFGGLGSRHCGPV